MKYLILITLLISTSTQARAVPDSGASGDGCIHCGAEFRGGADKALGDSDSSKLIAAIGSGKVNVRKPSSVPDFSVLGARICSKYLVGNITGGVVAVIKDFIIEEVGIENPTKEKIVEVLNENNSEITCDNGKHFIHHAFELGKYNEIVRALLIKKFRVNENIHYNFNNVTMTYNPETKVEEPMTVVDYIDKVALKTFGISGGEDSVSKKHIKWIRKMITKKFGAVPFEKLPLDTQAKYR